MARIEFERADTSDYFSDQIVGNMETQWDGEDCSTESINPEYLVAYEECDEDLTLTEFIAQYNAD